MGILCKLGLHRWKAHWRMCRHHGFLQWLEHCHEPGAQQLGSAVIVPTGKTCTRCGKVRK